MRATLETWLDAYMHKRKAGMSVTEDECWIPDLKPNGLGYVTIGCPVGFPGPSGKTVKQTALHRVSYWYHKGPFDTDLVIAHTCHNSVCFNPDHLRACTQQENVDDQVLGGKAPGRKLTAEKREYVIESYKKGIPVKSIAEELNVNIMTIRRCLWNMGLAGGKVLRGASKTRCNGVVKGKEIRELEEHIRVLEEMLEKFILD